jgi:hypothetical protein
MSEDRKPEDPTPEDRSVPHREAKPDPIEDVRKGLGLLFRAAKSAIESLPTGKVEDVVITGAREVGRAIENVTQTIDKQLFKRERPQDSSHVEPAPPPSSSEPRKDAGEPTANRSDAPPPPEEPKGPRVG